MKKLEVSHNAMILGRGVVELKDAGKVVGYRLSGASEARVSAMWSYYRLHREAFQASDSMIVASGGYGHFAENQVPPPEQHREGRKIADILIHYGIPHHLIEVESDSTTTAKNFQRTIEAGFFEGKVFNNENPLLVVASRRHGEQRGVPLARAAFGINEHGGVGLLVAEAGSYLEYAKEYMGGLAVQKALKEVRPAPFNADDMGAVGNRYHDLISSPLSLAYLGTTGAVVEGWQVMSDRRPEPVLTAQL